jgi:hypothetical protein
MTRMMDGKTSRSFTGGDCSGPHSLAASKSCSLPLSFAFESWVHKMDGVEAEQAAVWPRSKMETDSPAPASRTLGYRRAGNSANC